MKRKVNTNSPVLYLDKTYSQQHADFKPHGLWYSIDDEWTEWCTGNMPEWVRPHIIEIEVDLSNVLIIETPEQLVAFYEEYKIEIYSGFGLGSIDWKKITERYSGIEIINYHSMKWDNPLPTLHSSWFYAWDINS